ncbi:MAG: hypothetical protein Q6364_10875 [Candidatus Hermodarchaeota archaeon]|nr:hypothetical protein [Candidatus Hermodarchaeota archaeon]
MGLLEDLNQIHTEIVSSPQQVDADTRRHFWRIVGQIKRQPAPDDACITKAAEIRDLLYEERLGKPRSLKWLFFWFLCGTLGLFYYVWLALFNLQPTGNFWVDLFWVYFYPGALVAGIVFLFYPFGRLIFGKALGIRLDGITRDIYYLPTLKINYTTYLKASPPRRQWFFFFAGYWTAFTALWVGTIGFVLGGEWVGIAFGLALAALETLGAFVGGKWGGELGHFHRERQIVKDWKRNLETT